MGCFTKGGMYRKGWGIVVVVVVTTKRRDGETSNQIITKPLLRHHPFKLSTPTPRHVALLRTLVDT